MHLSFVNKENGSKIDTPFLLAVDWVHNIQISEYSVLWDENDLYLNNHKTSFNL